MKMIPEVDIIPKLLIEPEDFYGHMVHISLGVVNII
jgi:hypothetical protein